MKLLLNTWERLMLTRIVGSLTGDARLYHKAGKVLDVLEMSETERNEIDFRQIGNNFHWDDVQKVWELEVRDQESKSVIHLALRNYRHYSARDRGMIDALWAKCEFSLEEAE